MFEFIVSVHPSDWFTLSEWPRFLCTHCNYRDLRLISYFQSSNAWRYCMAGTIDSFPMGKMFFLMQNIFIVPAMQHGYRAKPLFGHILGWRVWFEDSHFVVWRSVWYFLLLLLLELLLIWSWTLSPSVAFVLCDWPKLKRSTEILRGCGKTGFIVNGLNPGDSVVRIVWSSGWG